MSFARKVRRKKKMNAMKQMGIYCCGKPMLRKSGYDKDDADFYFCEICGKERNAKKGGEGK